MEDTRSPPTGMLYLMALYRKPPALPVQPQKALPFLGNDVGGVYSEARVMPGCFGKYNLSGNKNG